MGAKRGAGAFVEIGVNRQLPSSRWYIEGDMKLATDYRGVSIRITYERLAHIIEHPELSDMEPAIMETLNNPEEVRRSQSDDKAFLYYRFLRATPAGDKYLCAVVKEGGVDAFLLTAYLTDKIKKSEMVWKKK
ncbi:MAG: hypothetical protein HY098_09100 [Nitrospinae bacterium]|nr:hypothetical protein [Nitrospinota bacterium]